MKMFRSVMVYVNQLDATLKTLEAEEWEGIPLWEHYFENGGHMGKDNIISTLSHIRENLDSVLRVSELSCIGASTLQVQMHVMDLQNLKDILELREKLRN